MPNIDGAPPSGKLLVAGAEALNQVSDLADRLLAAADVAALLGTLLDAALDLLGACSGNVRRYQDRAGVPELVVQRGIPSELLDYFRASGTEESMLCETALQRGRCMVIEDVQSDPSCGCGSRKIAAAAGFRALLAAPLAGSDGRPLAVLCLHFRLPGRLPGHALRVLDLLLHQAVALLGQLQAEQALRDSHACFAALAEAAPALVWRLDADGNAVFLNRSCLQLAGWREPELTQRGWQALIHPEDAAAYLAALARARREQVHLQQQVRLRCGGTCWRLFESHAQPWFDADGRYAGHVVMSIDITDAVQSEQARTTYRMATEGGDEGFFILRPVYGENHAIADFEFIDSNQCGAAYLGHLREELIGKKMSALYYTDGELERPMRILRRAMAIGFFEDDLEVVRAGPLQHRWVHCKIMRAQGDLAVTLRDISEAKAHVDELERRSNEDALTGLPNRHWLQDYLPRALARAAEDMSELALLFMDLDGFKQVNDTNGHPAGDELLKAAAHRLQIAVRPQDKVVRVGGDEFLVILENLAHHADAAQVAARIVHAFDADFLLPQGSCSVGTSIGISLFPSDAKDAETLLRHADTAMYEVKGSGKRNYRFFAPQCDLHAHPA